MRAFRSRDRFFCEHQKVSAETLQDCSAAFVCDHIAVKAQCVAFYLQTLSDYSFCFFSFFFRQRVFHLLVLKEESGSRGLICCHWLQVASTTFFFFPLSPETHRLVTPMLFAVHSSPWSKKPRWWVLLLNQNQVNLSQGGEPSRV